MMRRMTVTILTGMALCAVAGTARAEMKIHDKDSVKKMIEDPDKSASMK